MAIYLGSNEITFAGLGGGGYMPNSRELITKTFNFTLADTNYSSITSTISTTAQTLTLPATSYSGAGTSITCFRIGADYDGTVIDQDSHDYIGLFTCVIDYNYGTNNMSGTIHGIRSAIGTDYHRGKYRTINGTTGKLNTTYSYSGSHIGTQTPLLYQKADGTYNTTSSRGIYHSSSGQSLFVFNNSSDYVDLKCGNISVKADASYCPVESLQAINPSATTIRCIWTLYEGDKNMYSNYYATAYELVANKEG